MINLLRIRPERSLANASYILFEVQVFGVVGSSNIWIGRWKATRSRQLKVQWGGWDFVLEVIRLDGISII